MENAPIVGCRGCNTTAGRMGCPQHGCITFRVGEEKMAKGKRADECLFCCSRSCYFRIWSDDGCYDEVACRAHGRDLELHADVELRGKSRMHRISTAKQVRGGRL